MDPEYTRRDGVMRVETHALDGPVAVDPARAPRRLDPAARHTHPVRSQER